MIRVLVVSPNAAARRALEQVVVHDSGLTLVGTRVSLGGEFGASAPDVMVLDAPPDSLGDALRFDTTPVVVLLDDIEHGGAAAALRAGARAVLPRDAAPAQIRAAVRAAAAGLVVLPATLARSTLNDQPDTTALDGGLTPREREILALLGEGLVNKEIAVRLSISEHTVKTHLAAIYEKLEASNRAEAVATGLRRGLILL